MIRKSNLGPQRIMASSDSLNTKHMERRKKNEITIVFFYFFSKQTIEMAVENFLPTVIGFQLRIYNYFEGMQPKNALHLAEVSYLHL